MSYIRSKMINGCGPYYYRVSSERDGEKVRQRYIAYIGKTRPTSEAHLKKNLGTTPNQLPDTEAPKSENMNCFTTKTTGMVYYDSIIQKPKYRSKKGKQFKIVDLTPEEYIRAVAKGSFGDEGKWKRDIEDRSLLSGSMKYRKKMQAGTKFDMPILEYGVNGQTSRAQEIYKIKYNPVTEPVWMEHEGRHRAIASISLCKKLPVLIVYPEDPKALQKTSTIMSSRVREIIID